MDIKSGPVLGGESYFQLAELSNSLSKRQSQDFYQLLKPVDKFTYLESSVSSTETDINTRLAKAWTAINRLSVIWKSVLADKMKPSFF